MRQMLFFAMVIVALATTNAQTKQQAKEATPSPWKTGGDGAVQARARAESD